MSNIKFIYGNIFTSKCQTLVNTINCSGIMGAGIALEIKYRYPELFTKYVTFCENKQIAIGSLWLYKSEKKWILNFPTKNHWKYPSKIEYLEKGLNKFVDTYKDKKIESIAFPLLGNQNGKLDPIIVKDLMIDYLSQCDIPIEIYDFNPYAKDDLFDVFSNFILNYNIATIKEKLNISDKVAKIIIENIKFSNINSIIQLINISGIGDETMQKIFNFCMSEIQATVIDNSLFRTTHHNTNIMAVPI